MRKATVVRKAIVVAAAFLTAAGCSQAAPDPGPAFDGGGNTDVTCMKHQLRPPGTRYTDDTLKRTDEILPMLRYYTANGRKPYCDGAGPSDTDRSWARLYVQLGADRVNVASLMG